jgi:hypothetical protein
MYCVLYSVLIALQQCGPCVSCVVQPPLSEQDRKVVSVYGMDVHTALTAKVLKLLRKSLFTNFFVPFIMLKNINKNFFR